MTSRRALDPPAGDVVVVSEELVQQALAASRSSERQRMILPFHKNHEDPLHRMLNAMQPGTYVQPHRHLHPPKGEIFLMLKGAIDFVAFNDEGEITDSIPVAAGAPSFGIDLAAGRFHTFLVREVDTVVYEIKMGPYAPATAKDFAPWAPPEGSKEVPAYLEALENQLRARRLSR